MIYAIGDIHGCHDQLLGLIAKIKSHAGQRPYRSVFLGDYVDRGPNSRQVVKVVRSLVARREGLGRWQALKGNHEDMMVTALADEDNMEMWLSNGGYDTLASYEDNKAEMHEHAKWLANLPTMVQTENHAFVHAGCSPRHPVLPS